MPARPKLTDEILKQIREMAKQGLNTTRIAKKTGFARGTIKKWCKDHHILLQHRIRAENIEKNQIFIKEIKKHGSPKKAAEIAGLKSNGQYLIDKHNLRDYINSKSQPKLDMKEVQKRLPDQSNKVIDFKNGKYIIETKDGYIYEKSPAKLYQGDPRNKSGTIWAEDYIEQELLKIGYTLIPKSYSIKRKSLRAKCNKCNNIRINRFTNFFKQRCPTCSNTGVSKTEAEICEWVVSFGFSPEKYKFKGKTRGKEIDIYIPSLNLGIEYCGLYWHNENSPTPRDKQYHHQKMTQCQENNIRLITIFEDEWKDRNKQVKNFLKSVMGIYDKKIFARKCQIKETPKEIAKEFLEDNHIQGKTTFILAIGLYYHDELVGLVTGNKHHRQGHDSLFVLNRLVFKDGVQVVGGASKLLKYLIKATQSLGYEKIISWSDNRWSEGNVYIKTGFKLTENLSPDYSYYDAINNVRLSKQSNKKKLLLKKGAIGDMSMTEYELAKTLELYRIWDCGKKRWEIDL